MAIYLGDPVSPKPIVYPSMCAYENISGRHLPLGDGRWVSPNAEFCVYGEKDRLKAYIELGFVLPLAESCVMEIEQAQLVKCNDIWDII